METAILNKVKLAIRISHTKLDDDIRDNITGCLADLKVHGIQNVEESDPLILNAVKLWCKSIYTDDTAKAAEYMSRYEALRDCLKVAKGYGWEAEDAEEAESDE